MNTHLNLDINTLQTSSQSSHAIKTLAQISRDGGSSASMSYNSLIQFLRKHSKNPCSRKQIKRPSFINLKYKQGPENHITSQN